MFGMRPLFFATYRDLYDALLSAKHRISNEFMHEFLRERGLILSYASSRKELVESIATYAYDYADLEIICDQLETTGRNDRVSHTKLSYHPNTDQIKTAFESVREERKGQFTERLDFNQSIDGKVSISIDYYKVEEGRTALRQQIPKHGVIEFIPHANEMEIRFPDGDRISDITLALVSELKQKIPQLIEKKIDLSSFNKAQRTQFFQLLIHDIFGYKLCDVKKVNVNKDINTIKFESDSEDENEKEYENYDDYKETTKVETEVRSALEKCSLDGTGILNTKEVNNFLSSGFFISRIIWEVRPNKKDGKPKAELEALLENPVNGTGFKYSVRAIYNEKRDKNYSSTRKKPSDNQKDELLLLVTEASQRAFDKVASEQSEKITLSSHTQLELP